MQKAKAFEQKERLIEEEVGTWNLLELPFYVHLFCHRPWHVAIYAYVMYYCIVM